jgi:hypothetical protein
MDRGNLETGAAVTLPDADPGDPGHVDDAIGPHLAGRVERVASHLGRLPIVVIPRARRTTDDTDGENQ